MIDGGNSTDKALNQQQFNIISSVAHREAGLVLSESKSSMIAARISKRLSALGIDNIDSYLHLLQSSQLNTEIPNFISSLTTNVSHFFREEHHFQTLKEKALPQIREGIQKNEKIRIWSAGCSKGQELYSAAISMAEEDSKLFDSDVKFLGTDIDPDVVRIAKSGRYLEQNMKGLSESRVLTFFKKTQRDGEFQITNNISQNTSFKVLNLHSNWPLKLMYDVIFCRNVVIYFDDELQRRLWKKFYERLKPGGWLFIGHSERIPQQKSAPFISSGITTYRKPLT